MGVGVDHAGDQQFSIQFNHPGRSSDPLPDLRIGSDRNNPIGSQGNGFGDRSSIVHRYYFSADQDQIGFFVPSATPRKQDQSEKAAETKASTEDRYLHWNFLQDTIWD
jgi:hypothetical protein